MQKEQTICGIARVANTYREWTAMKHISVIVQSRWEHFEEYHGSVFAEVGAQIQGVIIHTVRWDVRSFSIIHLQHREVSLSKLQIRIMDIFVVLCYRHNLSIQLTKISSILWPLAIVNSNDQEFTIWLSASVPTLQEIFWILLLSDVQFSPSNMSVNRG